MLNLKQWQCRGCGEMGSIDPAWRWTGKAYEHRCAGVDPQVGYHEAVRVVEEATEVSETEPRAITEPTFYIASLYHTSGENICWWGPNNSGYSLTLESAGVYTQSDLDAHPGYYDSERNRPIPCAEVVMRARRVVDSDKLRGLVADADFRSGRDVCAHCGQRVSKNADRGLWETEDKKECDFQFTIKESGSYAHHSPRRNP